LAQDDYYYEIQLTNKQLVFYFMAGAAGLILSFLAGVMVGRGVDSGGGGAEQTRPLTEEKVVAEQPPAAAPSAYSYPQRLESDHPEEGLERPRVGGQAAAGVTPAPAKPVASKATPSPPPSTAAKAVGSTPPSAAAPTKPASPPPTAAAKSAERPTPAGAGPAPHPTAGLPQALPSGSKGFAVQVVALKDRASADSVVGQLKGRGLPAYVVVPVVKSGGLFTVRVGVYRDRADAELVVERLRDDKFKPYIVKQ
jgi:cell division septation protein DedD